MWQALIEAADVIAPPIDPVTIELLRPQAAFNHALLDVLMRWPQLGRSQPDRERERRRLEGLLEAPRVITSHRPGLSGKVVEGAKRVLVPVAERVLSRWVEAQAALNR